MNPFFSYFSYMRIVTMTHRGSPLQWKFWRTYLQELLPKTQTNHEIKQNIFYLAIDFEIFMKFLWNFYGYNSTKNGNKKLAKERILFCQIHILFPKCFAWKTQIMWSRLINWIPYFLIFFCCISLVLYCLRMPTRRRLLLSNEVWK